MLPPSVASDVAACLPSLEAGPLAWPLQERRRLGAALAALEQVLRAVACRPGQRAPRAPAVEGSAASGSCSEDGAGDDED
eukprot:8469452-Pyramimonas_sp.AAC.1